MLATYDLETQPTTYDFVVWLVNAITNGATTVSFINFDKIQVKKYPVEVARWRFKRIVKEVCALAPVDVVMDDSRGERFSFFWKDIWHLKPWKFPYKRKYDHMTVTLRDSPRNTFRNSNRKAWEAFARQVDAVFIDDADITYLPVAERWDLYQCRLNFFVDNGPASLAYFSDAPYISMKWNMTPHLEKMGFREGFQFPWAKQDQVLVWKDDTLDNIWEAFARYEH